MAISTVIISGSAVGLVDLEDIFAEVRDAGLTESEAVKDRILAKVKARNYIPPRMEPSYREELYEEYLVFTGVLPERRSAGTALDIRLYGTACANCTKLDVMVKQILSQHGLRVDYQYLTDMREIARAGILSAPALVIAGTMILAGRVPSEKELETMLLKALDHAKASTQARTKHDG